MRPEYEGVPYFSLFVLICDRGKDKKVTDFFEGRGASCSFLTLGRGTAGLRILNYLGLGETEKTVLFSILPRDEVADVLSGIDAELDLKQPGHGIAFTVPVDGACAERVMKIDEDGGKEVGDVFEHELILAVVNRGYNQDVMDAARDAKATGGTILHAKGFALDGASKFFGVTLQPEKEVVMILAPHDRKEAIMQAIADRAGVGTPAGTVTFSLPVTGVAGLAPSLTLEDEQEPSCPEAPQN